MKKARRVNAKPTKTAPNRQPQLPMATENDLLAAIRSLAEFYPAHQAIQNSYVLSRFWAWFSQIRLSPKMHVPMPRFLTVRDP